MSKKYEPFHHSKAAEYHSIAIGAFYLEPRKATFRILSAREEGLMWDGGQLQGSNTTFGRIQIWEVMDTNELVAKFHPKNFLVH